MFDFLTRLPSALFPVTGETPARPPAAAPVAKPPGESGPDLSLPSDAGQVTSLFQGMVEDSYGAAPAMAAPAKEPPPTAHHLNRIGMHTEAIGKPVFGGMDPMDLVGEANGRDGVSAKSRATQNLDETVMYYEGFEQERDLERRQAAFLRGYDERHPGATEAQRSGVKIGLAEGAMPIAHTTELRDLDSAGGKLQALNVLSQNRDPNDPNYKKTGEASCVPASIVAGVLYAEGRKGLETLLGAVKDPDKPDDPQYLELKEKLAAKGEALTVGDLQNLQDLLYQRMKLGIEGAKPEDIAKQITSDNPEERAKAYVKGGTMKEFMRQNPKVREMFINNRLDLTVVDTTGDGDPEHCILRIGDEHGKAAAYYDPWQKHGHTGQIINAQDGQRRPGSHRLDGVSMDDYVNAGAEDESHRAHLDDAYMQ